VTCADESNTVLGKFIGESKVLVRVMMWVEFGKCEKFGVVSWLRGWCTRGGFGS